MFDKYEFSKDWRNPSDFPTVETDENKVREDMQLLHEETKNAIHSLVEALALVTAALNIGVADKDGNPTTLHAVLTSLLTNEHNHVNLAEVERIATVFAGKVISETVYNDPDSIPTSKAVFDKLLEVGAGDMLKLVYDTKNKNTDIFDYADAIGRSKADSRHTHDAADLATGALPPERGGTGETTLHDALVALLTSGELIINPNILYEELPSPGVENRLILKVVT